MKKKEISFRDKIYNFFEQPKGKFANAVQIFIVVLIFVSVGIVAIEFLYHPFYHKYEFHFHLANYIILGIFTIEYGLRLLTTRTKLIWVRRPMNIVDFLAIAPNYVELLLPFFIETTEIRVLRLLRLARILRGLRLFRYSSLFQRVFQYQNTVLEAITPVLLIFIGVKGTIWILETFHFWIRDTNLGELFAIIGFALGIILSQKIATTYDKFLQVEEAGIRLYGILFSLKEVLNSQKKHIGTSIVKEWVKTFLAVLTQPNIDNVAINTANSKLYKTIHTVEKTPSELAILYGEITREAAFCLSKKTRLTPKAYDTLLHQATILYLGLIAGFIPGLTGMISLVVATYILYGMYNITQDLDSIFGGEFNLMNIDLSELEYLSR